MLFHCQSRFVVHLKVQQQVLSRTCSDTRNLNHFATLECFRPFCRRPLMRFGGQLHSSGLRWCLVPLWSVMLGPVVRSRLDGQPHSSCLCALVAGTAGRGLLRLLQRVACCLRRRRHSLNGNGFRTCRESQIRTPKHTSRLSLSIEKN
jgi:hypothetical protein